MWNVHIDVIYFAQFLFFIFPWGRTKKSICMQHSRPIRNLAFIRLTSLIFFSHEPLYHLEIQMSSLKQHLCVCVFLFRLFFSPPESEISSCKSFFFRFYNFGTFWFLSVWGVITSIAVLCMRNIQTVKVHLIVSIYQLSYCTFWNL